MLIRDTVPPNAYTNGVTVMSRILSSGVRSTYTEKGASSHCDETSIDGEAEDVKVEIDVMASVEYQKFITQYTDKNDNFSYQLMNKDLMQFSAKSSVATKMLAEKTDVETIVKYVVNSKAAELARTKGMDEEMLTAFIEIFDSMNTRSAFKELRAYLRGKMSRKKR